MTGPVTVAVVAFAGFNEIDVLANLHILNRVTAGGCLASAHLSAWLLSRLVDPDAAADTLATVAPVGRRPEFVADVMKFISPERPIP
jgi:hypothetical protein